MDERQWLLATAYNTGMECFQSVDFLLLWMRYSLLVFQMF